MMVPRETISFCGVEQRLARRSHKPEVVSSSLTPATKFAHPRSLAENGMVASPRADRSLTAPVPAFRSLVRLLRWHPAGERNDNSPAGPADLGGGPVRNLLGDVAEQQPAILFSIRRRVGKPSDGAVLDVRGNHPNPSADAVPAELADLTAGTTDFARHLELHTDPRSVQGSVFKMSKRNLISAQMLAEARAWADELTAMEITGPGDLDPAWRRIETRYGIPYSTLWSLKYRHDLKDIWASLHRMLQLAVEHERSRRVRLASHHTFIEKAVGNG